MAWKCVLSILHALTWPLKQANNNDSTTLNHLDGWLYSPIDRLYWCIVPVARVEVGIVGDSPDCTDAPQGLKSNWTHYACHEKLSTFPAINLTVLACFSPRAGRRALEGRGIINLIEIVDLTIHLSKASPGACQSLLRGFSLAFLYKYDWVIFQHLHANWGGGKDTWNQGCRRDRRSAWPSPSWWAAAPPKTSPSKPWSKHDFSATDLHIWQKF